MSTFHYLLCGWHVVSEFSLSALAVWRGTVGAADVTIRSGDAACDDSGATWVSDRAFVTPHGDYRIAIDGVASYLVRNGRDVTIDRAPGCDDSEMQVYLLGTILAVLCYQRGLFPLHASCVRLGDGAHAFTGVSGAGKSTLAACLAGRDFAILSDDICAIDLSGEIPLVLPSIPRVKLWPDMMAMSGLEPSVVMSPEMSANIGKRHFEFAEGRTFDPSPTPLTHVHFLETADPDQPAHIMPIRDAGSIVTSLLQQVPRIRVAQALGLGPALFDGAARIARAVSVSRLVRCAEPSRISETLDLLAPRPHG